MSDPTDLAAEVVQRFTDEASRVGCALHLQAAGPVPVQDDHQRRDQVLTNLVGTR